MKEMLPEDAPPAVGVNEIVYVALLPIGTVIGNVIPLTEYPEPIHAAEETTTSAFVAYRVPFKEELSPTATFPKFSAAGETASVPDVLPEIWL